MFFYRLLSRVSGTICRTSLLFDSPRPQHFSTFSNHLHSLLSQSPNKLIPVQASLLRPSINSSTSRFGFSSSAPNDEQAKTSEEVKEAGQAGQAKPEDQTEEDSDSESELELSMDDLIKLVAEKEKLSKLKQKEIEKMQDKVLRAYADMENVMDRTRRESENSKKFAIQNFAKSLLDVADNLGRASSVVKESFSKLDTSADSGEAVKLLKTLLEGVEMTEKQLSEVLKKFGVEKFDPTNEPFDPHRHNAVFQIPDDSKPPGTVAAVLKAGYLLHDRVIRPAEVGVTQEKEDNSQAE